MIRADSVCGGRVRQERTLFLLDDDNDAARITLLRAGKAFRRIRHPRHLFAETISVSFTSCLTDASLDPR